MSAGPFASSLSMDFGSLYEDMTEKRKQLRRRLDDLPDFHVEDARITFRQTFETVEAAETHCPAPPEIVDAERGILKTERVDSIANVVRATIFFHVGCNTVPLYALVSGGRGRKLFEFRCVFEGCSSFLDIRFFSGVDVIKWVLMCVSHSHTFTVFPPRMPRSTFPESVQGTIREMANRKVKTPEIKMEVGAVCNGDVFQNVLRSVRTALGSQQCRELRNAASSSSIWESVIHLTEDNMFVEAFFANAVLASKHFPVDFVYLDNISCANVFSLPLVCVLSRDASSNVHTLAWGVIKNGTTTTFRRFFDFVKN